MVPNTPDIHEELVRILPRWLTYGLIGTLVLFAVAGAFWWFIDSGKMDPAVSYDGDVIPRSQLLNRSEPEDFTKRNPDSPNTILLVTLDTIRTDHLSAYGYPKKTSPFLEELAESGVKFTRAYAPMSTTAPSHATILSALYPLQHRILKNGLKMSPSIVTLTEMLNEAGYRTAAFVSTDRHFGSSRVAQGFDHYDDPERAEQLVAPKPGSRKQNIDYRPGKRTVSAAKQWLTEQDGGEKTFLWVHLFDPHRPYVPRSKYLKDIESDSQKELLDWVEFVRKNHHFDLIGGTDSDTNLSNRHVKLHRFYDSEIRYMDSALEDIVTSVKNNLSSDPFMVVAGDHGEGMGNHDWWGHGKMIYNEQIRVPLILNFPDGQHAGSVVEETVELTDVMPTVLRAVDVPDTTLRKRREPIEGTPLQNAITGDASQFRYAFTQRRQFPELDWWGSIVYRYSKHAWGPINPYAEQRKYLNFELGRKFSLLDGEYKYIYSTANPDQAYNLKQDYYEQRNLFNRGTLPKDVRRMGVSLDALVDSFRLKYSDGIESVDAETREKLKGLGYVN